jgi:hypothetical protein
LEGYPAIAPYAGELVILCGKSEILDDRPALFLKEIIQLSQIITFKKESRRG